MPKNSASYMKAYRKRLGGATHEPWRIRRLAENRALLLAYLQKHPCVDCSEDDPVVLTFDHVRGQKSFHVANMLASARNWASIFAEIQKCDVRCFNCHMRRTAKQRGWKKLEADEGVEPSKLVSAPLGGAPCEARECTLDFL